MALDATGGAFAGVGDSGPGGGNSLGQVAALAALSATIGGAIALSATRSRKKHHGPSMIGIDHKGAVVIPEQPMQWWPEQIQDSIAVGWSTKTIPGASHGLMQWGANDGRTIAFELKLTRSMRYIEDFREAGLLGDVPRSAKGVNPDDARNVAHNVDIRKMVRYLRAYCYPDYDQAEGGIALPPVFCLLHIPGLQLSETGDDTIWTVMTACDATYTKAFRDGKPRTASVSLSFKQVVQSPTGVRYKNRQDLLQSIGVGIGVGGTVAIPVARDLNKINTAAT